MRIPGNPLLWNFVFNSISVLLYHQVGWLVFQSDCLRFEYMLKHLIIFGIAVILIHSRMSKYRSLQNILKLGSLKHLLHSVYMVWVAVKFCSYNVQTNLC